mgnify:FL=1
MVDETLAKDDCPETLSDAPCRNPLAVRFVEETFVALNFCVLDVHVKFVSEERVLELVKKEICVEVTEPPIVPPEL